MAEQALVREKMRSFMDGLSPAARAMLARRDAAASWRPGEPVLAVLSPVRTTFLDLRSELFAPFAPFVVDEHLACRQPGWIERASLEGIWTYACRELLADEFGPWANPRPTDLDAAARAALVARLSGRLFAALVERRDVTEDDPRARQRFVSRLGGESAFADLDDLLAIRHRADDLKRLFARLPVAPTVGEVGDRLVVDCITEHLDAVPADALLVAAGLANRMSSTATLARIAVTLARSTVTDDIRRGAGALFIDAALSMCERQAVGFRSGKGDAAAIERYHEGLRGLVTVIDITGDGRWLKRLAAIRTSFSDIVAGEIERLVPSLRAAFRLSGETVPSDSDADLADHLSAIYQSASAHRDGLAINGLLGRVRPVAEQAIQLYGEELARRLRGEAEGDRAATARLFERFLAVASRIQGEAYAAYLRRGAASPA